MEELKKCPFCGGNAEGFYKWNYSKRVYFAYAQCTICHAIGHSYAQSDEPSGDDQIWDKVAAAWNMRTPE